jgi:hypothetical protein
MVVGWTAEKEGIGAVCRGISKCCVPWDVASYDATSFDRVKLLSSDIMPSWNMSEGVQR